MINGGSDLLLFLFVPHLHGHKQTFLIFRSVSLDDLLSLHGALMKMTVFQHRPLPPF